MIPSPQKVLVTRKPFPFQLHFHVEIHREEGVVCKEDAEDVSVRLWCSEVGCCHGGGTRTILDFGQVFVDSKTLGCHWSMSLLSVTIICVPIITRSTTPRRKQET